MRSDTDQTQLFDTLFSRGSDAVLAGEHTRDVPPVEGGRWPVTVVSLPPDEMADVFEGWMRQVLPLAGPGHFLTGLADQVHLTVRALEAYRELAAADDELMLVAAEAMRRTAAQIRPFEVALTGFTLTSGGVMAQLRPVDDAAWRLMDRLEHELGVAGGFETRPRTIWYANLVHFAADIADPQGLVDWVSAHRAISPATFTIDSLSLVRYRHGAVSMATDSGNEVAHAMELTEWLRVPLVGR